MTAIYDHRCKDCGPVIVETETISEYLAFKEEYGLAKGGNVQVPCPSCGKMAPRDFQAGTAPFRIKGGMLYKSAAYSNEAKKNWYREEVANIKEVLKFKKGQSPYTNMTCDPESVGASRISDETAKERARAVKNTFGSTREKVNTDIARSKI